MSYNGWNNRETWLVNIWYMDSMPEYFAEMEQFEVAADELRDAVQYISEESEALSQLPAGLLSDFVATCWAAVNWYELAQHLNQTLAEMETENA